MKKFYLLTLLLIIFFLMRCGTPNDPESIIGGDGGYKIVSKYFTSGFAQDVVVNDTLAYIAQSEGGLMIINISDHKAPKELSTVSQGLKGSAYKLTDKDSVIYIAAGGFGLSVINAANPLNPIITETNLPIKPAKNVCVLDNFLFTAIGEYGVKISGLEADPSHPDPRGETAYPGFVQSIYIIPNKNYMLIACGEMGFAVVDISQMGTGFYHNPMIGWVDTPGYAEDVVAHPTLPYAFLACGTSGLFIIDFSDSSNVKIVGSYSTGGYAKEVLYKDNKVYVTTELRGLQIFDVTNINSPMRIGTVETAYALGLTADDKYIYVADENEGLIIISIP
jgi:hypothetical protein